MIHHGLMTKSSTFAVSALPDFHIVVANLSVLGANVHLFNLVPIGALLPDRILASACRLRVPLHAIHTEARLAPAGATASPA